MSKAPSKRNIMSSRGPYNNTHHMTNTHHMMLRSRNILNTVIQKDMANEAMANTQDRVIIQEPMAIIQEAIVWDAEFPTVMSSELKPEGLYAPELYYPEYSNPHIISSNPKREAIYKLTFHDKPTIQCMSDITKSIFDMSENNIKNITSNGIFKLIYQYRQEPSLDDNYEMIIYDALSGMFFPNHRLNHQSREFFSKFTRKNGERAALIRAVYDYTIRNANKFIQQIRDLTLTSFSPVGTSYGACDNYIQYGVPLFSGISSKLLDNSKIIKFIDGTPVFFPVRSFTLDYRVAEHFAYTREEGVINRNVFNKVIFVYLCKGPIPYVSPSGSWECEAIFGPSNFICLHHSIVDNVLLVYVTLIPGELNLTAEIIDPFIKGKADISNNDATQEEDSDTEGGRRTRRMRKSRENRSRSKRGKSYKRYKKKQRRTKRNPFSFMVLH